MFSNVFTTEIFLNDVGSGILNSQKEIKENILHFVSKCTKHHKYAEFRNGFMCSPTVFMCGMCYTFLPVCVAGLKVINENLNIFTEVNVYF